MTRIIVAAVFLFCNLMLAGCGNNSSDSAQRGGPAIDPGFEDGNGTVVLSGRIN